MIWDLQCRPTCIVVCLLFVCIGVNGGAETHDEEWCREVTSILASSDKSHLSSNMMHAYNRWCTRGHRKSSSTGPSAASDCVVVEQCHNETIVFHTDDVCVEFRGYSPDAMCTVIVIIEGFEATMNDLLVAESHDVCSLLEFTDVDVADDQLVVEFIPASSSGESVRVTNDDDGLMLTTHGEGYILHLVSNDANHGLGVHFKVRASLHCGDAKVDEGEMCDTGYVDDGYVAGCSCCQETESYVCESQCYGLPSQCHKHCGDGIVQADKGEECDTPDTSVCNECKFIEQSGSNSTCAEYEEHTGDDGVISGAYDPASFCSWALKPESASEPHCTVFRLFEMGLGNDELYVYGIPDFTEVCYASTDALKCGSVTVVEGGSVGLPIQGAFVTLTGNGDSDVGSGLLWAWSSVPTCGNGVVEGMEACDDGGNEDGDGCSSCCVIEAGYTCDPAGGAYLDLDGHVQYYTVSSVTPSSCWVHCGDGSVEWSDVTGVYEECDDGDTDPNDGCDACVVSDGYVCFGSPSVCWGFGCGNGYLDGTEECDDGNRSDGDGCEDCLVTENYHCYGEPSVCACHVGFYLNGTECLPETSVLLVVENYDGVDCDCALGNSTTCCLSGALGVVEKLNTDQYITICLGVAYVHFLRDISWRIGLRDFRAGVTMRPCDDTTSAYAYVDFDFGKGFLAVKNTTFSAERLLFRRLASSSPLFYVMGSTVSMQDIYISQCVIRGSSIISIDESDLSVQNVLIERSYTRRAPIEFEGSIGVARGLYIWESTGVEAGGILIRRKSVSSRPSELTVLDSALGGLLSESDGAIRIVESTTNLMRCNFTRNGAYSVSGGQSIVVKESQVNAEECLFADNGAIRNTEAVVGGSVINAITNSNLVIKSSAFYGNGLHAAGLAPGSGSFDGQVLGSVLAADSSTVLLEQCLFVNNTADLGGTIAATDAKITVDRSYFYQNSASQGGVFYVFGDTMVTTVRDTTLSYNEAHLGSVLYSFENAQTVFQDVTVDTWDPANVIYGSLVTCERSAGCGQNALCEDREYGIHCTCPPGMLGDPNVYCIDSTATSLQLLGSTVRRSLSKPDYTLECVSLESTGGLGQDSPVVSWEIISIDPPAPWLTVHVWSGSAAAGYCGSSEDDEYNLWSSVVETDVTLPQDGYQDCFPLDATHSVIPLGLDSQGQTQGEFETTILIRADTDSVREFTLDVSLTVLTISSGNATELFLRSTQVTQQCMVISAEVGEVLEFAIVAKDIEGLLLGHGGEDVTVTVSSVAETAATCAYNVKHHFPDTIELLSLTDLYNGVYNIRLKAAAFGEYAVNIYIGDEELGVSPLVVKAACGSDYDSDDSGTCVPKDHIEETIVIAVSVVGSGLAVFYIFRGLRERYRRRKGLMSEFGWKVFLFTSRVLLNVLALSADACGVAAVLADDALIEYRTPFLVFVTGGDMLVLLLVFFMTMTVFAPHKQYFGAPRVIGGRLLEEGRASSSAGHRSSKNALKTNNQDLHKGLLQLHLKEKTNAYNAKAMRRVMELSWEYRVVKSLSRDLILDAAIAILKDLPLGVMLVLITFSHSSVSSLLLFHLIITSISAGVRIQGLLIVRVNQKRLVTLSHKIKRIEEKQSNTKLLYEINPALMESAISPTVLV